MAKKKAAKKAQTKPEKTKVGSQKERNKVDDAAVKAYGEEIQGMGGHRPQGAGGGQGRGRGRSPQSGGGEEVDGTGRRIRGGVCHPGRL